MRAFLTTATCAAAFFASSGASAQDWSGGYVGGNFSLGMFDSEFLDVNEYTVYGYSSNDGFGGVAGVEAGYNWQIDNLVWGIEAEANLGFMDESTTIDFCSPTTHATDINTVASLKGKAGVAADKTLFYATGGIASINREDNMLCETTADSDSFLDDGALTAIVLGLGLEYRINDNMSANLEWNVYHADDKEVFNGDGEQGFFDMNMQTVTVGVKYYFWR